MVLVETFDLLGWNPSAADCAPSTRTKERSQKKSVKGQAQRRKHNETGAVDLVAVETCFCCSARFFGTKRHPTEMRTSFLDILVLYTERNDAVNRQDTKTYHGGELWLFEGRETRQQGDKCGRREKVSERSMLTK
jgi:hypothetical protein